MIFTEKMDSIEFSVAMLGIAMVVRGFLGSFTVTSLWVSSVGLVGWLGSQSEKSKRGTGAYKLLQGTRGGKIQTQFAGMLTYLE